MNYQPRDHGIYASADTWRVLRNDPAFVELLRLARVVNSLGLAYGPLLAPLEDQSPRARRDRFAAFMYSAALLKEGLHTSQGLAKYFRELPQYKSGFAAILDDKSVTKLQFDVLKPMRNELVFHFDRGSLAAGIAHFSEGEALIATATSNFIGGEIYFDAADDALLGYLFGAPTEADYLENVGRFMKDVTDLFERFMKASHSLIPAALLKMGCYGKPVDRPAPPEDATV